MRNGIKLAELSTRYGNDACENIFKNAPALKAQGLVNFDEENLSLTRKGFLLSNYIINQFI